MSLITIIFFILGAITGTIISHLFLEPTLDRWIMEKKAMEYIEKIKEEENK